MEVLAYTVPAQICYMEIPSKTLLKTVDKLFPDLAKNSIADCVAGRNHRYKAGHDLLLDIPETINNNGIKEGLRHAGHIILTDFPTKAGVPLPGFSHSGLGEFLEEVGINKGWLQVNICDAGVGIIAIAEGNSDLVMALAGTLDMSWGTFFDTYVEGSLEICFALAWKNPLMLIGSIENCLAGVVASWNSLSIYIDPLDFLGSSVFSAIIGFSVSYGIAGNNLNKSTKKAVQSGVVGALYSLSSSFAFGALIGFASYRLGKELANQHMESMNASLSVNKHTYELLLNEICQGNIHVSRLLEKTHSLTIDTKAVNTLPIKYLSLESKAKFLPSDSRMALNTKSTVLSEDICIINDGMKPLLSSDPTDLVSCYQMIFPKSRISA